VDRHRGPSPLVHGGPSEGCSPSSNPGRRLRDRRLGSPASARRRRQAGSRRRKVGTSPGVRRRARTRARVHGFGQDLALREAGTTRKLLRWLGKRLRRPWWLAPRGAGRWWPVRSGVPCGLVQTKRRAGDGFSQHVGASVGEENDEGDDGVEDQRRRSAPMGGGGDDRFGR
jgi:hypothetical protein